MFHPLALFAALLALAFGTPATVITRDPAPAASPAVPRVVEQREITVQDGGPISLSPDGRWLAAWTLQTGADELVRLCVYDTSTYALHRCTAAVASIDFSAVAWSPDGTRLAFTEDAILKGDESDLWVLEIARGTLTNLTDDGYSGNWLDPDAPDTPLDRAPAWSPDGQEIAFVRNDMGRVVLVRIAAAGGEPREVWAVKGKGFIDILCWSHDGQAILYAVLGGEAELWQVGADGRDARRLAESGVPVEVSAQGAVLVFDPQDAAFAVLEMATGRVVPIRVAKEPSSAQAAAVTFSPDGSRLLLAYQTGRIAVRDLDGGSEQTLVEELDRPLALDRYGRGLDWADNDLVWATTFGRSGMLLQLVAG